MPRVTPGSEVGSQGWPECPLNSQHMFELRFAYRDTVTPQLANVVTVPQSAGTTKFDHKWGKLVSEQTEAAKRTAPKSPAADGAFQRQYGHLIQKRENAEKVPV